MLNPKDTVVIIIDVQEKLLRTMYNKDEVLDNLQKLIEGAKVLEVPVVWTEQYPEGLGPTVPELARFLTNTKPIEKRSFSCCGEHRFIQVIEQLRHKHVVIAGIETHVCVYQTTMDLLRLGYEVQVVADAVSSRTEQNKQIGLQRMHHAGAIITGTEMSLFELLRIAEGPTFKEILKIIK